MLQLRSLQRKLFECTPNRIAGRFFRTRTRRPTRGVALLAIGLALVIGTSANLLAPARSAAATSNAVNFQARLETAAGAIVPDGFYNVQFKLYSASSGGSPEWTESYTYNSGAGSSDARLQVINGYLTANLGSLTAFSGISWDQQQWLTMNIGGTVSGGTITYDGEMNPRLQLTAVPYAFRAGQLADPANSGSTLTWATQGGANSILLPNAAGTLCIQASAACGFESTSGTDFIQNQTASPQSAGFNINGNGTIGGTLSLGNNMSFSGTTARSLTGPSTGGLTLTVASGPLTLSTTTSGNLSVTSAGTLALSSTGTASLDSSSAINIGINNATSLTLGSTANNTQTLFKQKASATALQVLPVSGSTAILDVDSTNNRIGINTNAPAAVLDVKDQNSYASGVAAPTILNVLGGTGGLSAAGGAISLQGGIGGIKVGAGTAGAGGAISLIGGTGGDPSVGTGGNGGNITINGGTGGAGAVAGTTGIVQLQTGGGATTVGGTINGQTISSSAIFTGTVNIQGGSALTLGTSSNSGALLFASSGGSNKITLTAPASLASAYSLTLPTAGPSTSQCLGTDSSTATQLIFTTCSTGGTTTLQGAYTASTGANTPEIILDTTRNGIDIQDKTGGTIGVALFNIRGVGTASTLGASLFTVSNSGQVAINNGSTGTAPTISYDLSLGQGSNRTLGVEASSTGTGNSLTVSSGSALSSSSNAGGTLNLQGGGGGSPPSSGSGGNGGALTISGGSGGSGGIVGGGSGGNGGAVTINGGTAGTGTFNPNGTIGAVQLQTGGGATTVGGTFGVTGATTLSSTTSFGDNISFSGTTARSITGPSTGGLTVTVASGPLTLSTTGSGNLSVTSVGTLALSSTGTASLDSSGAVNVGTTNATSLTFGSTANNTATIFKQASSATAFQVQNASTKPVFTVDTSANQVTLGNASNVNGQLSFANSSNAQTVTLASGVTTSSYSLTLPTTAGTAGQCLELGGSSTVLQFANCGSSSAGLAKNGTDTSSANVSASGFLYQFTNSSSAVASSVLQLDNGTNTNSTLKVTTAGNPTSGQALIFASNTNASASGNLIDLQSGSSPTSKFSVSAAGAVSVASGGTYTSAGSVNFSSTGANAINIDTGGAADINIAPTNASDVKVGKPFIMTDAGNAFQDAQAPTASTSNSLINLVTTGASFSGSSSGTFIGVSAATGFTGSLIDVQLNGTTQFSVDGSGNVRMGNGTFVYNTGSNTPNTTAYITSSAFLTSEMLQERFINANPTVAAITLTTPSASSIVAAIPRAKIGDTFSFIISNAGTKVISLGAGTGVTLFGSIPTTPVNSTNTYLCRLTNVTGGSEALTCY
jgi:hypothetical protein